MNYQCNFEHCFSDTTCALGYPDRSECDHWKEVEGDEVESTQPKDRGRDFAWNGYVLGTSDLSVLGGRGRPIVIGLVGPPDSGKTSLLAFVYMWLLKYGKLGDWVFAGSWTLGGWESVVQPCRWTGDPPPAFPPHTSSSGRNPGVLHMTLRSPGTSPMRDVMFTDAPGEWFTQWSKTPSNPIAAGARWVIEHSDVLVLLIDSAGLADNERLPRTRRVTLDLIERVAAEASVPVVVVWTKEDVVVPDLAGNTFEAALREFLPQAKVMRTTTERPETIEQCFVRSLFLVEGSNATCDVMETPKSEDPFLGFRGIHVNT